jgi:hypothetical protein
MGRGGNGNRSEEDEELANDTRRQADHARSDDDRQERVHLEAA